MHAAFVSTCRGQCCEGFGEALLCQGGGKRIEGNPVQTGIRVSNDDITRDKQLDAAISFLVQTLNTRDHGG